MDDQEFERITGTAARIIYFGLKQKNTANEIKEIKSLTHEYQTSQNMRDAVNAIANGLRLNVLSVEETEIYIQPQEGSIFSPKKKEVSRLTESGKNKYFYLILLALTAYLYPKATFLGDDRNQSRSINEKVFLEYILEKCDEILQKMPQANPEKDKEDLIISARAFIELKNESSIGSKETNTRQYYIRNALDYLKEQKYLIQSSSGSYDTTLRFRIEIESMIKSTAIQDLIIKLGGLKDASHE